MSAEERSLGEIRKALAGITHRLDALADAVGIAAASSPPGALLDEATRTRLASLESLLAVGRGTTPLETCTLGIDRALSHGRADCAAVLQGTPGDPLTVLAQRGFRQALEPDGDGGILGRALHTTEVVQSGPGLGGPDAFLAHHGLEAALAIPIRDANGLPAGALLVGRRRPTPFDADTIGMLMMVADRLADTLRPSSDPARDEASTSALFASLDCSMTADTVAREAKARLGAAVVAVLVPDGEGFALAGSAGLRHAGAVPDHSAALQEVTATQRPWVPRANVDPDLTDWLGDSPRAVLPLSMDGRAVAFLVVGGLESCGTVLSAGFERAAALALRNARLHEESLRAFAPPPPSSLGLVEASAAPLTDMAGLLAVLLGRLATARERVTDPATTRELADAEEAAWRTAEAVRGVLGFVPDSAKAPAVPVDLAPLVRDAVRSTEARWAPGGMGPAVALHLDAAPPVRVHPDEFRQVLQQLLENAREASLDGRDIAVRLRWDGASRAEVSVTDRGRGMDEATRIRAGEPFFTTKGPRRLGIGLAVARALAQRRGGSLELTTAPGQGTTVSLRLPTAGGHTPLPTPSPIPYAAPFRRRILVVDDEKAIRETLAQALEHDGYEVDTTGDVGDAVSLLGRTEVDLVVTDLVLPGGSGLEVARTVKRMHPGTPVILVTGWPGRVDSETLEAQGIDAIVEKPVGLNTLGATVASLIRGGARRAR